MGVGRGWKGLEGGTDPFDFEIWYFPINLLLEKCFSLTLELANWDFTTVPPLEKILPTPMAAVSLKQNWTEKRTVFPCVAHRAGESPLVGRLGELVDAAQDFCACAANHRRVCGGSTGGLNDVTFLVERLSTSNSASANGHLRKRTDVVRLFFSSGKRWILQLSTDDDSRTNNLSVFHDFLENSRSIFLK